jgi:hypothetical protein
MIQIIFPGLYIPITYNIQKISKVSLFQDEASLHRSVGALG